MERVSRAVRIFQAMNFRARSKVARFQLGVTILVDEMIVHLGDIRDIVLIETVVLDDEETVEQNREDPQAEFGGVAENVGELVVVEPLQEHLEQGKRATRQVKQNIPDRPTVSRFTPEIGNFITGVDYTPNNLQDFQDLG